MADLTETWCPLPNETDFQCLWRVEKELKGRGFSIGPLQGDDPRGIMPAEYDVAKWRNLNEQERAELVGVMTFIGSPRNPRRIVVTFRLAEGSRDE